MVSGQGGLEVVSASNGQSRGVYFVVGVYLRIIHPRPLESTPSLCLLYRYSTSSVEDEFCRLDETMGLDWTRYGTLDL